LPRDTFGLFALASTLGWLASVAGDFGIQVHLARTVALQPARGAELLKRWLPVRLGMGALALAVSAAALRWLGVERSAATPIVLFATAYATSGVTECLYYYFRGLGRTDIESSLTLLQRTSMGLLALGALWRAPRLEPLAWAMLIPAVVTLAAAGLAAARLARSTARVPPHRRLDRRHEFLRHVAPIGVGLLLSALYFRVDVFLLERWTGTGAVALYSAVFRLIDALRLFPAAVLAVALPALCRARDMHLVLRLSAHLTSAATGAAIVLWISAGWLIPALYGEPYRDAVLPFRVLLLSLPLMAVNYALTQQLIGWHRHNAYAAACGAALACNLAANWFLIPARGPVGAAWATLWTEAILTLGCVAALAHCSRVAASAGGRRARLPGAVSLELPR
jgi:O-antigen/teichoic acid export membrane protein